MVLKDVRSCTRCESPLPRFKICQCFGLRSTGANNEPSSFARLGGNGGSGRNSSISGYENEATWDEEPQEQEELHPSTAAAMAIAQANGDVNELQVRSYINSMYVKQPHV